MLLQQMAILIHQRLLRHVKMVYGLICYNILTINIMAVSQSIGHGSGPKDPSTLNIQTNVYNLNIGVSRWIDAVKES